jgi:hypothetical protein
MRSAGRLLVLGWLLAALVVLGMDGRLPAFVAVVAPSSALALGLGAVVRHQLAPSRYCRPPLPDAYRLVDDLSRPLAEVVAVAERDATR